MNVLCATWTPILLRESRSGPKCHLFQVVDFGQTALQWEETQVFPRCRLPILWSQLVVPMLAQRSVETATLNQALFIVCLWRKGLSVEDLQQVVSWILSGGGDRSITASVCSLLGWVDPLLGQFFPSSVPAPAFPWRGLVSHRLTSNPKYRLYVGKERCYC
jgi:hypothetical protein